MAKRKGSRTVDKNKSALIRQYKMDHADAKPREIAAALNKKGLKVSAQYVSTILSNERRKYGLGAANISLLGASQFSIDDIYLAKQLVTKTGSVKAAKQAIDCYSKLLT